MSTKRTKVLVVEDDPAVRNALSVILTNRDYDVLTATDGQEALERVSQADVVLLDLRLPKIDGEEFLDRIRTRKNYIPVVVMSAFMGREEGLEKLKDYKIVDFVEKPFTLDYIGQKIKAAASTAENIQDIREHSSRLRAFVERQQTPIRPAHA